jgi:DNA primase
MMSEFAFIPIGPILEYYGFDAIEDDRGWRPVRCAFHGETDASASVITTEDEQAFNCHACGMKGNAAQIIMKKEGVSYKDAVKRAEGILGGSSSALHGFRGTGPSLPSDKRDRQSYSEFKRTWLRS